MPRPLTYQNKRDKRVVFYIDEYLYDALKKLTEEANRSVSDYLFLLVRGHVEAVYEEENLMLSIEEPDLEDAQYDRE